MHWILFIDYSYVFNIVQCFVFKPTPVDDAETQAMLEVEENYEKQNKKLGEITYELDGIHRVCTIKMPLLLNCEMSMSLDFMLHFLRTNFWDLQ